MQYGVFLPNFGAVADAKVLVELAAEAERAEWDGFFIWDHILFDADQPRELIDPWVALTAVAVATERLRLGALITPLARRRPWQLARETSSLDRLSNGRLIVGAGLGSPARTEFEVFGEEGDERIRARKLDEGLAVLDGLWSGRRFSFEGEFFKVDDVQFLPTPAQQPRPRVWIAGWWPNKAPMRRAARWDGVFPELVGGTVPTPEDFGDILSYVRAQRQAPAQLDAVLGGQTPPGTAQGAAVVAPYIELGLTWWLERLDHRGQLDLAHARERIRSGPPRL